MPARIVNGKLVIETKPITLCRKCRSAATEQRRSGDATLYRCLTCGHEFQSSVGTDLAEECTCGIGLATESQRKHYGAEVHSPYCPVGRREREASER